MRLKIASLNVWGFPWPLTKDKRVRLQKIAEHIRREDIDIVALQELYLNKDKEFLCSLLPDYYSNYHKKFPMSPGLLTLSKFPVKKLDYIPLSKSWSPQRRHFKKGILFSSCNVNGKKFNIMNTHISYSKFQRIQKRELKRLSKNLPSKRTFILGDFNQDYSSLPKFNGFRAISDTKNPTLVKTNKYVSSIFNPFDFEKWTCDLIFYNDSAKVNKKKIFSDLLLSDHYMTMTEVVV